MSPTKGTRTDSSPDGRPTTGRLDFSGRIVDPASGRLASGDVLRPMEAALLRYLAERLGEVVPYDELLGNVWGYRAEVRTNTLHMTVCRLRHTLEPDPAAPVHLLTVARRGLRLVVEAVRADRLPLVDPLVGRAALLAHLRTSPPGALTVTGPSGVGKTRLVLAHIDEPGLPTWFVDVSSAVSKAEVLACLAAPLAHRGPMRVVVDGADGVSDLGPTVAEWARNATGARWIVTRRLPLGFEGERRVPVGPLALPASGGFEGEAAELLSGRIRALDPTFDPRGSESELFRLLVLTDGLPRAIALAAPRVAAFGPGAAEVLEAEGALGASIEGSWAALPDASRAALAQLAAFAHPFTLPLAARVVELLPGAGSVAHVLGELVAQGLVVRTSCRFSPLRTVRARAGAPPEDAVARHRSAWVAVANEIDAAAGGVLTDHPLAVDDADEVLHAATRAVPHAHEPSLGPLFELGVRLAEQTGHKEAADALASAVLAADPAPQTRIRLLAWWSVRLWSCGRIDDARSLWERLPSDALREGLPAIAAVVELTAAGDWFNAGRADLAGEATDRAERWAAQIPSPVARWTSYLEGRVAHVRGCLVSGDEAVVTMERAVHALLAAGRPDALARSRGNLIQVLTRAGRFSEALRQAEVGIAECPTSACGSRVDLLVRAALALRNAHRNDEALDTADRACRLAEQQSIPSRLAWALIQRGWVRLELGYLEEARADADRAQLLATGAGQVRPALMAHGLGLTVAALAEEADLEERLLAAFDEAFRARIWGVAGHLVSLLASAWLDGRVTTDPMRLTTLLLEQPDIGTDEWETALLHAELLRRSDRREAAISVLERAAERACEAPAATLRVARAAMEAEEGDATLAYRIVLREARIPGCSWAALHRARCANALGLPEEAAAALAHVRSSAWEVLLGAALAEEAPRATIVRAMSR